MSNNFRGDSVINWNWLEPKSYNTIVKFSVQTPDTLGTNFFSWLKFKNLDRFIEKEDFPFISIWKSRQVKIWILNFPENLLKNENSLFYKMYKTAANN